MFFAFSSPIVYRSKHLAGYKCENPAGIAKPAADISLGAIIRVLDGPLAPVKCVSQMAYEPCGCPDEETCGLRLVMGDVRNAIVKLLDGTSLADVTQRVDSVRQLFGN